MVINDRAFLLGMVSIHSTEFQKYAEAILETKGLNKEAKFRLKNALDANKQLNHYFMKVLDKEEHEEISAAFADLTRFMLDNPDKRNAIIELIKQL